MTRGAIVGMCAGLLGITACTQPLVGLEGEALDEDDSMTRVDRHGGQGAAPPATSESEVASRGDSTGEQAGNDAAEDSGGAEQAAEAADAERGSRASDGRDGSAAPAGPRELASTAAPASSGAGQGEPSAEAEPAFGAIGGAGQPSSAAGEDCGCDDPGVLKAELGELLFDDTALSQSGTLSCAGCHDAQRAHTGNHHPTDPLFPVSTGAFEDLLGTRNAPTARYAAFSPRFEIAREIEEEGEGEIEYVPMGGQFWDGRAASLEDQAGGPFLNPREMALPDKAAVIERVRAADYAPLFRQVYGEGALDDVEYAYAKLTESIAAFERTEVFAPFDSKFDAYLRGEIALSEQEAYGFALFKDPEKGNCMACHVGVEDSREPRDWLFTDFTYDNLGVPRNARIPDNDDPEYFDLGLCQQPGLRERVPAVIEDVDGYVQGLCGAFKVPTLRNSAVTAPYMHNGVFETLRQVVDFYATRDTDPGRWFPCGEDGCAAKFNDVPEYLRGNVNTEEAPMDRHEGEEPRLNDSEIDAIVAFMQTLTDGYRE